jgi:hypothetical protein
VLRMLAFMRRLLIVLLTAFALLVVPAVAAAPVNVPAKFSAVLGKVRSKSHLAVRLPSRLDATVRPSRVFGAVESVRRGRYHLSLGIGRGCHESTACYVASFFGNDRGHVSGRRRVSLARGLSGRFSPISCGASCGPAIVSWRQGGVVYRVEFKGKKAELVALANSAIRGGAR